MPHVSAQLGADAVAVTGVEGSSNGVVHRKRQVVLAHRGVGLKATAGHDDTLIGLDVDALAVGVGVHAAQDGLGLGVLDQGGQRRVDLGLNGVGELVADLVNEEELHVTVGAGLVLGLHADTGVPLGALVLVVLAVVRGGIGRGRVAHVVLRRVQAKHPVVGLGQIGREGVVNRIGRGVKLAAAVLEVSGRALDVVGEQRPARAVLGVAATVDPWALLKKNNLGAVLGTGDGSGGTGKASAHNE